MQTKRWWLEIFLSLWDDFMLCGIAVATMLVLGGEAVASPLAYPRTTGLIDAFIAPSVDQIAEFRVTQSGPMDSEVQIHCVEGCSVNYSEKVSGGVLAVENLASRAASQGALIATIWQGSTNDAIIIYNVSDREVKKVFEDISDGVPSILFSQAGELEVVVPVNQNYTPTGYKRPKIWMWSKGRFFEVRAQ